MSWSLKLFRIRGIDVKVHLSFVLILVWGAYHWGIALQGGTTGAMFGVVVTLLLFACVTLHELSHSLVAMHYGVKVRDITLLPIGGLSQMEKMPEKPDQELRMSLAGPLTNLVIAAVLIALSVPFRLAVASTGELYRLLNSVSWQGLLAYLVAANIMLGLFNLIPAFPMDGGRVLRAILAMRMDYTRATAWAVTIGQGLAWLLGLLGILSGGWTLALIALFIYVGGGQEGRLVQLKGVLGQIRVSQVMTQPLQVLSPQTTLGQVADIVLHSFQTDFPVAEGGHPVAFLTETDLISALKTHGTDTAVGDIMRTDFVTTTPDEPLFEAQQRMSAARLRSLPVILGEQIVGLLTTQDISEVLRLLSVTPHLLEVRRA
jgi:Zn-dependent protease/predicted transcriptional regulator